MKVLLFLREEICNGLINEYIRRLSKGLNACGIETDFYDISRYLLTPPPESELRNWPEKHYDAALAFNAIGQQNYMLDGENIYDRMGIPFYNYLLDHPLEHDPDVAMGPADYRIICLDRDHVDYVYKYYPNVKKCYFLPLPGVLTAEKEPEPFEKREYDLLFTGSFYSLGKLENEISAYSPMIRKYTLELIEYMLDHREKTFETGLTELLGAMGEKDLDPLTFRKYASVTIIAMRYVRSYVKIEAIRYLMESDIRMHIFGGGWEEYANEGSGATVLHPPVNYLESVDLCQKARIALNVMPLFKDGCHDRIPTAMLNGAAVLTDHSRYLDETMGGELYFFDISKPWEISGIVKAILADDISIQKRTEKAYSLAREKLSVPAWAKNVKDILD